MTAMKTMRFNLMNHKKQQSHQVYIQTRLAYKLQNDNLQKFLIAQFKYNLKVIVKLKCQL